MGNVQRNGAGTVVLMDRGFAPACSMREVESLDVAVMPEFVWQNGGRLQFGCC